MNKEDAKRMHQEHVKREYSCPTINGACIKTCRYYTAPWLSVPKDESNDRGYNAYSCRCDYNIRYNEE